MNGIAPSIHDLRLTTEKSYAYCERLSRREAGNFYHAFRLLPRRQRLAMCALYAFLRIADDLADGSQSAEVKRTALTAWRHDFHAALRGTHTHPLHPALADALERYHVPHQYLEDVLDGVETDLEPVHLATFADLYRYCYRVAGAVGLACIHIWGYDNEQAKVAAESAGIAFQLTNILRDLGEDASRGRVYLPVEDLERFGVAPAQLQKGLRDESFRALMQFQVERARSYYDASLPLAELLDAGGRAVFQVLLRTYRGLLDEIEQRDYDVFTQRVRVSGWFKLKLFLQALPIRWGWAYPSGAKRASAP